MEIKNSIDRFQEALLLPERPPTSETKNAYSKIDHIMFENYSAVYPGQKYPQLHNLNFEIENGTLLGVIGMFMNPFPCSLRKNITKIVTHKYYS